MTRKSPPLWLALCAILAAALCAWLWRAIAKNREWGMANKPPKRWPNYAEWHRLEAIAGLQDIQRLSREAQRLMSAGQVVEAVILLGDVRERATATLEELKKAKDGER